MSSVEYTGVRAGVFGRTRAAGRRASELGGRVGLPEQHGLPYLRLTHSTVPATRAALVHRHQVERVRAVEQGPDAAAKLDHVVGFQSQLEDRLLHARAIPAENFSDLAAPGV